MTSEARERSWADGKPIQYFRFTRGNVSWFLTNADRDQEYLGETWTSAAISRSAIRQGSDSAQLTIKVTLPSTQPVASNWRPYPPSEAVVLTIFVRHVGETDALAEWVGRVVAPKFSGPVLELSGEPSRTRNKRNGNVRLSQPGCDLVLYGLGHGQCNLNPEIVPLEAVVTNVAELTLSVTAAALATATRSLAGGMLEWIEIEEPDPEDPEAEPIEHPRSRPIAAHSWLSTTITLGPGDYLPAIGDTVTASTRPLYVEAVLTAVSGLTLSAAAFGTLPSGRLAGGFLSWVRALDGLVEFRSIRSHVGNQVTLDYGALDIAVGLQPRGYPGCAHSWSDCGYHANQLNYGGDLYMPAKSPFDGNPVW
ncbi:phage BR0599 family protein [Pseudomonas chengduensis]